MVKDYLKVQKKKFVSGKTKGHFNGIADYSSSDLLKYLRNICVKDPQEFGKAFNFFDGNVLANVRYTDDTKYSKKAKKDRNGPTITQEVVKIKWQPANKKPSELIRILTKDFGLKEVK